MLTLGIDIGSTTSKCVLLKDGLEIVAKSLVKAGTGTTGPDTAYNDILKHANIVIDDVAFTVATGYGRKNYDKADSDISELSAHAKGVYFVDSECKTIIDIGGQDAKVIKLGKNGNISDFVMNDKCAAGTGRFLDVMANILQLQVDELADHAAKSENPSKISSTCTVFAESEVISQLSNNVPLNDLIAGICASVASRTAALAKRLTPEEKVYMSGGVALNDGVLKALEKEIGMPINKTQDAQFMGALGAAVAAYEKAIKNKDS